MPAAATAGDLRRLPPVPRHAPDFVKRVTAMMIEGQGDLLPVSALPVDGTFPTGTAQYEKRSIALEIPIWDPTSASSAASAPWSARTPRSARRSSPSRRSAGAPGGFQSRPWTRQGASRLSADHPGRPRRLHRLRRLRRRLPGPEQGGGQAQGDQHGAEARPSRRASGPTSTSSSTSRELDRTQVEDRHRSRARSSCSRCSSSRAPAPAAARRPT